MVVEGLKIIRIIETAIKLIIKLTSSVILAQYHAEPCCHLQASAFQ